MYKITTLNKIAQSGLARLPETIQVTDDMAQAEGIIVRSAKMHDMELPESLLAIARAGVGVNNIPLELCADRGIVVFNTPGANANGVKELVLAGMIMAARNIPAASQWAVSLEEGETSIEKQVESGKSQFKGTEIAGKTIGVIGLGGIGGMVANACAALGMKVYGFDAYLSVRNAHRLSAGVKIVGRMEEMLPYCDFLTMHLHANAETNGMINADVLNALKPGAILLNFSRASIVDAQAVKEALASGQISRYVTDFPNADTRDLENVILTPHLGASTMEAEDNCAAMAADEIADYLENGNIVNSVNFPPVTLGARRAGETRVCILTKGLADPAAEVIPALTAGGFLLRGAASGTMGDYGYVLVSGEGSADAISALEGVTRVRVLQ